MQYFLLSLLFLPTTKFYDILFVLKHTHTHTHILLYLCLAFSSFLFVLVGQYIKSGKTIDETLVYNSTATTRVGYLVVLDVRASRASRGKLICISWRFLFMRYTRGNENNADVKIYGGLRLLSVLPVSAFTI